MTKASPAGAGGWVVAAVAALLLVAVTASSAADAPPDRAALTRMDRVIRDGMERSGVPGFAVAVVSGNDVVHARGFGDAGDNRPATTETVATRAGASALLVALPALSFGWRALFLWQPDVFTVIVLIGGLLLVTAALRLARLVRRSPTPAPQGPVSDTMPADTDPTPALVAR